MMFLRFLEQKLKKLLRNKIFIIWGKEVVDSNASMRP